MLNIVCVNWDNYAGRGIEYVIALRNGVKRHLGKVSHQFVCLTDHPEDLPWGMAQRRLPANIIGWWNKIAIFQPGLFRSGDRVIYFDLDTVVIDSISDIAAYQGSFAALTDVADTDHIGSGVMAWEAGTADHIWHYWHSARRPSFHPRGDQAWIEAMVPDAKRLQDLFPGKFVSFKRDCQQGLPSGASVVYFHGPPRPHECEDEWVKALWNGAAEPALV